MSVRALRKGAATLTAALMLAGGLTVAGAGTANAATCYGGKKYFSTDSTGNTFYPSGTSRLKTTSRCNDINIDITNNLLTPYRQVRVCFYPTSGSSYCQSSYKKVYSEWKVIATNVIDGTKFRFQFKEPGYVQAYWAA